MERSFKYSRNAALASVLAVGSLWGCGQSALAPAARDASATTLLAIASGPSSKIRHVVIIFQENRSVDDLFNGLNGADTVRSGKNSDGKTVKLRPILLTGNYDISHEHSAFVVEEANGKLDGFNNVNSECKRGRNVRRAAFVPTDTFRAARCSRISNSRPPTHSAIACFSRTKARASRRISISSAGRQRSPMGRRCARQETHSIRTAASPAAAIPRSDRSYG